MKSKFSKKLLLLLVILIFKGCCGFDEDDYKWTIADFEFTVHEYRSKEIRDTIFTDSASFNLEFTPEFVSTQFQYSNGLNATSCPDPGDGGLIDGLTNIIITSDTDFENIPSGMPLNDILDVNGNATLEYWINLLKGRFAYNSSSLKININERPLDQVPHKYFIELVFESGDTMKRMTNTVLWL